MATNSNNNNSMNQVNNTNNTTVRCPQCGAEFAIPEHERVTAGITIGKDSGLGVINLTIEKPGNGCGCTLPQTTADKVLSVKERLMAMLKEDPEAAKIFAEVAKDIEESGYIEVPNILRRWVSAQALRMIDTMRHYDTSFTEIIKEKGINYPWKVLLDDLKKQEKLYRDGDEEAYNERKGFYSKTVACEMAEDFINGLKKKIEEQRTHDVRRCKGRKYIPLKYGRINNGRGIFLDQINDVLVSFNNLYNSIYRAATPTELVNAVQFFDRERRLCKFDQKISLAFVNAYKAVGGYYTMKDLIMFEGCRIKADDKGMDAPRYSWIRTDNREFIDMERSLELLDDKMREIMSQGVECEGYKFLGILKDFLDYNNFNYDETKQKWYEQSKKRRELRKSQAEARRPRK